jgi:glycosyltransferase involved in cell wall biosynthesis
VNILRIADVPNDRTGGMSRYIQFVTAELRAAGHCVDLVFAEELRPFFTGRLRRFATPARAVRLAWSRIKSGERYDVVEIHEPLAAAYAAVRRVTRSFPPLLVSVYALETRAHQTRLDYARSKGLQIPWQSRIGPLSVVWQANFGLRFADHIAVETNDDTEYLCRNLGIRRDRITIQCGGVDSVFFEPAPNPGLGVLFVGSWTERKGIRDLVPALTAIRDRYPGVPLTIAGCGCPAAKVLAEFPGRVRGGVRVVPSITEDRKLAALYREHSVFAFPSTFEGQPLALLEAAASGLAITTTRTCGMKDFISDGENGLLVAVGDGDAFARAVCLLIESPELARKLGHAARESSRMYTWRRSADQFLAAAEAATSHSS